MVVVWTVSLSQKFGSENFFTKKKNKIKKGIFRPKFWGTFFQSFHKVRDGERRGRREGGKSVTIQRHYSYNKRQQVLKNVMKFYFYFVILDVILYGFPVCFFVVKTSTILKSQFTDQKKGSNSIKGDLPAKRQTRKPTQKANSSCGGDGGDLEDIVMLYPRFSATVNKPGRSSPHLHPQQRDNFIVSLRFFFKLSFDRLFSDNNVINFLRISKLWHSRFFVFGWVWKRKKKNCG